ncbi:MAG TPA: MarR family transcriptional regulator [Phycisphaerae bacterium]|nr:MarR family transcriptional regulator [Phycisphaerae bacterium]HNU46908.1 MarR family transcriptional regulator [Phycisphaerae bacterium]
MPNKPDSAEMESMAKEIFDLAKLVYALRSQRAADQNELTETEFLTLDALVREQPLTIGELQHRVGVVPAQMSRIVRALETARGKGFLECTINAEDRRRVDVSITPSGMEAYEQYRALRLASTRAILAGLTLDDRRHFMRILRLIRTHMSKLAAKPGGA